MAEQVIDIRQRIEKMRIKFEDDHKTDIHDEPNLKKNVSNEEKKRITNFPSVSCVLWRKEIFRTGIL